MSLSGKVVGFLATNQLTRKPFWRVWYEAFGLWFGEAGISFMNYGYVELERPSNEPYDSDEHLQVKVGSSGENFSINLYHKVASTISLSGKEVLEVGCGRGGGSCYIAQTFSPAKMVGVDFSSQNIKLCDQQCSQPGLSYEVGDAENLQFQDESFDVLINVESSHCYNQEERFFSEVARVLRPEGYFLFADFRPTHLLPEMAENLKSLGLEIVDQKDITPNILRSLDLDNERKLAIIRSRDRWFFNQFLSGMAKSFAGNTESPIYKAFESRNYKYFLYVLRKKD